MQQLNTGEEKVMEHEEREKLDNISNYAQAISMYTSNINENIHNFVLENDRRYEAYMNVLGKIFWAFISTPPC